MKSFTSCGPRIRFEWTAASSRLGEEARCAKSCERADVLGADLRALYRRQRELSWLSRHRIGHRRRIAAGGWKAYVGFMTTQPPIVRRESAGRPHGGWLAYRTGGHVMSIAPTLKRYLTAENIQYEEIPHEFTMSSNRTAEACHVSGDRLAKGIVLRRDGDYMLVVMPASHHLRLPELRTKLGDNVDMANEAEINRLFRDCAHGAVPAVGKCYGLDVIVDDSIEAQPEIYMEAGDHETLLHLSHAQFARLMANAPHGRFSAHD